METVEEEQWLPIPGNEEYEVSSEGNVRRVKPGRGTRAGKPVKPAPDAYGRLVFNLAKKDDGRRRQMKVHQAVCLAFHGPKPEGHFEVAHNDGDHTNNRKGNVRWATPVENNGDKVEHGTQPRGTEIWNAKLDEEKVLWARRQRPAVSYSKLGEALGVSMMTIYNAVKGKTWKHIR